MPSPTIRTILTAAWALTAIATAAAQPAPGHYFRVPIYGVNGLAAAGPAEPEAPPAAETSAVALAPDALEEEATVGAPIQQTAINPSGGTGPYAYEIVGGAPSGISVDALGRLTGAPGGSGQFTFAVRVTDSTPGAPKTATSGTFSLIVREPLSIVTVALPTATTEKPYAYQVLATGGDGTYAYEASGLPSTVTMSPSGVLSGTPAVAAAYPNVTVSARDAHGRYAERGALNLTVLAPAAPSAIPRPDVFTPDAVNAGLATWTGSTGLNVLYDASTSTGIRSTAGNEAGGFPKTLFRYAWSTPNKANCVIAGIRNRGASMQFAVQFSLNGTPVGTENQIQIQNGLSTRTIMLTGATGSPDVNELTPRAWGPHTNYEVYTFRAGYWDGTDCMAPN